MKSNLALGFTLVELLVTVAIIGISLTLGVPAFKDTIRNSVLTSVINEFVASLNFARSEAVKRGVFVTVRKTNTSSDDAVWGSGWEGGWQVFTDVNSNGTLNSPDDQVLRVHEPLRSNLTLRGNHNFINRISYKSSGESNNIGSFALCDTSVSGAPTKRTSRLLTVSILGRITQATDSDGDGFLEKIDSEGNLSQLTSCTNP